jgi:hypothetical protein
MRRMAFERNQLAPGDWDLSDAMKLAQTRLGAFVSGTGPNESETTT